MGGFVRPVKSCRKMALTSPPTVMPMTHVTVIGAKKTGTRKPVPVYDASDMQFGIEFFW